MSRMSRGLVTAMALIVTTTCLLVPKIAQDPSYHQFADRSERWGIRPFGDVMSNVAFMVAGVIGLMRLRHKNSHAKSLWLIFSLSVIATGLGSIYYHLNPNMDSLFWDRLPMSLAFMSILLLVAKEYLPTEDWLTTFTPVGLMIAPSTVVWWWLSEQQGSGDLRPYALVQMLSVILILVVATTKGRKHPSSVAVYRAITAYLAAKVFEHYDYRVLAMLGGISGHTIKHLLAAYSCAELLTSTLGQATEQNQSA